MKFTILLAVLAALFLLRFLKVRMLTWFAAWWVACFIVFRFGFETGVPWSVVRLYMGIATAALLIYVCSDEQKLREFFEPIVAFMTEKRFQIPLAVVALLIPALAAGAIYLDMTSPPTAPTFGRTVHPAPPEEIEVHETPFDLRTLESPVRALETSDPDAFGERVANGRVVYYENCFYCHGDLMRGEGMFAHALNPIPTNFQDAGTIAQLQESFLFWRIAKGAPGLPAESGPWDSAMPAWEKFLTEDEMWDVAAFLYEFTGAQPRTHMEGH